MDSDDVVAVTQEEYSDMQFPYKSPINAMKILLEYNVTIACLLQQEES
jgi:hypothetical protein